VRLDSGGKGQQAALECAGVPPFQPATAGSAAKDIARCGKSVARPLRILDLPASGVRVSSGCDRNAEVAAGYLQPDWWVRLESVCDVPQVDVIGDFAG